VPGEAEPDEVAGGVELTGDDDTLRTPAGDEQEFGEDAGMGDDDPTAPEDDDAGSMPGAFSLAGALESLLFVSDEAVEPAQLARATGVSPAVVEAALLELDAAYRRDGRGLRLQVRNGRYQMVTAPEAANLIESYLNLDASARLSGPALETLAVVAYRQPVTRAQIEAVRGVDCSGVLRSLLGRGLLEEVGRLDAPGRPVLYGVTDLFMHHFGLTALHELPPLEDAEIARIEEVGA
jgi:segregation and condensation protein B